MEIKYQTITNCQINSFCFRSNGSIVMKRTVEKQEPSTSKKFKNEEEAADFINSLKLKRLKAAESISEFKFNKKRVKILTEVSDFL